MTRKTPSPVQKSDPTGVRLNVFLQEHGVASRRKADELIQAGRVKLDNLVVRTLGLRVAADAKVAVDGVLLNHEVPKVIYLFNKPDETLTTRAEEDQRQTIFQLPALRGLPRNVQAVGRLDYRSEGLLILTNDGDLAYALTHPRYSVEKTYAVLLADLISPEDIEKLRKGIKLEDGMAQALSVRLGSKEMLGKSRGQWLEIVVTEGRNRLIRRMMEALGLKVLRLVRIAVGDLRLPDKLTPGHIVAARPAELKYLMKIKKDMTDEVVKGKEAKPSHLTEDDMRRRRLNRKMSLNNNDYADEVLRRSAKADSMRQGRKSIQMPDQRRVWKDKSDDNQGIRMNTSEDREVAKPTHSRLKNDDSLNQSRAESRPESRPESRKKSNIVVAQSEAKSAPEGRFNKKSNISISPAKSTVIAAKHDDSSFVDFDDGEIRSGRGKQNPRHMASRPDRPTAHRANNRGPSAATTAAALEAARLAGKLPPEVPQGPARIEFADAVKKKTPHKKMQKGGKEKESRGKKDTKTKKPEKDQKASAEKKRK